MNQSIGLPRPARAVCRGDLTDLGSAVSFLMTRAVRLFLAVMQRSKKSPSTSSSSGCIRISTKF